MFKSLKNIAIILFSVVLFISGCTFSLEESGSVTESRAWGHHPGLRNVILFIADGMGAEHVKAASFYEYGVEGGLSFQQFPFFTTMTTSAYGGALTDSSAAATAIATGVKVNPGTLSLNIPGDSLELYTLLEYFRDRGFNTGLTTTTAMTNATPAAFGAHQASRYDTRAIADDYFTLTRPNLLFGGGGSGITTQAEENGYSIVRTISELLNLNFSGIEYLSGQFGQGHLPYEHNGYLNRQDMPHLSEMTRTALDFLRKDHSRFFLMVEGGNIDFASHSNNLQQTVHEVLEFSRAVKVVERWMRWRWDTLLIVLSDHETGGLQVEQNNGPGEYPAVSWSSGGHTNLEVNVYATGFKAYKVMKVSDNTDFYSIITEMYESGSGW